MQPLDICDARHVRAAEGWLGLGLQDDAGAELDQISPAQQKHPQVLGCRWELLAARRDWDAALRIAGELLTLDPEHELGWLHYAYSIRRSKSGGLAKASEALRPAAEKFPGEPVIPFNLACYACQMGNLEEAREWFRRAIKVGGEKQMKLMALGDEDFKPLWEEISDSLSES
jgi:tetratricopeptide (TPR) repeat protein